MCGIVGALRGSLDARASAAIAALRHRGPDGDGIWFGSRFWLGHTRLAIVDVTSASAQPFRSGDVVLTFNGEIWNFRELRSELEREGVRFTTSGDTEVLAAAIGRWGEGALERVEGMFSLAWTTDGGETIRVARDRFGETPLHIFEARGALAFASEVKGVLALGVAPAAVRWVEPGTVLRVDRDGRVERRRWYSVPDRSAALAGVREEDARSMVRVGLGVGVMERAFADVPVCTLLSGGIDSSAVALHLSRELPGLVAYAATLEGSRSSDMPAARAVAKYLGVELREVVVPRPSADDLRDVVLAIETASKAQVEIGWACVHLARRIRADGFRVAYSGEGSDELWGSYGMAHHGIEKRGWYAYRRELFAGQHRKNFARCNKVFMAAGVECRLPFLSTGLVETALSLPRGVVRGERGGPKSWKRVLTEAYRDSLPSVVLDRAKVTFQSGVGGDGLQGACAAVVHDPARYYRAVLRGTYGEIDA